jgi:hypothetical protein
MSVLLRPDFLFVSVILPILVMIGGWIALKLTNRWVDRDIARERAEKARIEAREAR